MINLEAVNAVLVTLGGYSSDELTQYSTLVQNCANVVEASLTDASLCTDSRVIFLAAARAYYNISLIGTTGEVSSFSAGDVRLAFGGKGGAQNAKAIFEQAICDANGLIEDNGFVFRGV